jgi:DNA polymerase
MKFKSLSEINKYFIKNIKSDLQKTANNVVPGIGSDHADIMFIGEAPGRKEDETGIPFVGSAGKFLDELLNSINLSRSDVFITNTVKYRPPENRDPSDEEKAMFKPWLDAQIAFIQPKIFVPLGRHALWGFLPNAKISDVHGKIFFIKDTKQFVFAMYHPAVALYNGSYRKVLLSDMQVLKTFLDGKYVIKED